MKPETALTIIIYLLPAIVFSTVQIEGWTHNGAAFSGQLLAVENGFIHVSKNDNGSKGIPVKEVAGLRLRNGNITAEIASEVIRHEKVLHLWSNPVYQGLINYAESLGDAGEWNQCYRSTSRIVNCASNPAIVSLATELKGLALFKLGLLSQCRNVLQSLLSKKDPIEVSTRVCWMMAFLEMDDGDSQEAAYWAMIPKVRIPSDNSELAMDLYQACQSWQQTE